MYLFDTDDGSQEFMEGLFVVIDKRRHSAAKMIYANLIPISRSSRTCDS